MLSTIYILQQNKKKRNWWSICSKLLFYLQLYLGSCQLQSSSNPVLVTFWREKKCVSSKHLALARDLWHLLEFVWVTTLPWKRKCFIVWYPSVLGFGTQKPSGLPEQINNDYRGATVFVNFHNKKGKKANLSFLSLWRWWPMGWRIF